jgi:hypothetical protein
LMEEKTPSIWKEKLDWIAEKGGMALLITHPDYIDFDGTKKSRKLYPANYYVEFLQYVKAQYKDQYWQPLPREVARFIKENAV